MFGKAKLKNCNAEKTQNQEFQSLKNPKLRIPLFGKAKFKNSNIWKSLNPNF